MPETHAAGRVELIQRFPIKGLSPEHLDSVVLAPGDGVPGDRLFGFARHGSGFDARDPRPVPKDKFVVLLTQAGLAGLQTQFKPEDDVLQIQHAGGALSFDMASEDGKSAAARWLYKYLLLKDPAAPEFVSAAPHRFTDVSVVSPQMMNAISILNRETVRDLSKRIGVDVSPARFRANIEIDGLPAWSEMEHVGSDLQLGNVSLRILKRTKRCAATEVNPDTADRDIRLPYLLRKEFGHMDLGIYAEVIQGGHLTKGDTAALNI